MGTGNCYRLHCTHTLPDDRIFKRDPNIGIIAMYCSFWVEHPVLRRGAYDFLYQPMRTLTINPCTVKWVGPCLHFRIRRDSKEIRPRNGRDFLQEPSRMAESFLESWFRYARHKDKTIGQPKPDNGKPFTIELRGKP